MNLAEALVQALPELPTQVVAKRKFRFNPNLVVRDDVNENGAPIKIVFVPEKTAMYYLEVAQFNLYQLFNGERDYEQVAEAYREQYGVEVDLDDIRSFALGSVDTGLWYESAQERNITLSQKLKAERSRRVKLKGKFSDLSHIVFQGWDPDKFLNWVHGYLKFIYTPWFTLLTLGLFAFMTYVWIDHWSEIGRDTLLYYTFTEKTFRDIVEFWLLFLFMAFFHESAHGLTAKHYGASVHNMGFQLIYLAPAFAIELTELWARVGRLQRLWAILAGVWIEMVFCAFATVIWWSTVPGTGVHEWAYKLMMITGIIVLIVNLNPLMKLDGYYALAEIVGISELKENSTAFLSGWTRKHIFGLPAEYDYVPFRRRLLYVPYGILSGAYSYLLLFAVSRFTYNVFHRFTPEWAFLPAGLVAWKIFKSRIIRFFTFMKTVYLVQRERLLVAHTKWPLGYVAAGAVIIVLLLTMTIFRKTEESLFVLEPMNKAVIRAQVPGMVETMFVSENAKVTAGSAIAQMRNVNIASEVARSKADLELARANRTKAQLLYTSLGSAQSEFERAQHVSNDLESKERELRPVAPIDGVVTNSRTHDLEGRYVREGTVLAEVEDFQTMRARLYLPEHEVRFVRVGAPVSMKLNSSFRTVSGVVRSIAETPSELPSGLVEENRYKGLNPPAFYVVDVAIENPGWLRSGMAGDAKIFVRRESVLGKAWQGVRDLVTRKVW